MGKKTVLLSFDLEEFDTPLEYGAQLSWEEQVAISKEGTEQILGLLHNNNVPATFYSTVSYAKEVPSLIKRLIEQGHELASHGMKHSGFSNSDLVDSRKALEEIAGQTIFGFRMPRMMPVDDDEIKKAGYFYNSSLNPTIIPGRYNNFNKPRQVFYKDGVCQFPASVSTSMRVPLFWMSFHNLPFSLFKYLCKKALKKDGYLHLYFHPWEFANINDDRFKLPFYIRRNCGEKALARLADLITWLKNEGADFKTSYNFLTHPHFNKDLSK